MQVLANLEPTDFFLSLNVCISITMLPNASSQTESTCKTLPGIDGASSTSQLVRTQHRRPSRASSISQLDRPVVPARPASSTNKSCQLDLLTWAIEVPSIWLARPSMAIVDAASRLAYRRACIAQSATTRACIV